MALDTALQDFLKRYGDENQELDPVHTTNYLQTNNVKNLADGFYNADAGNVGIERPVAKSVNELKSLDISTNQNESIIGDTEGLSHVSSVGANSKGGKGMGGMMSSLGSLGSSIPSMDQSGKVDTGYLTEKELQGTQTGDAIKDSVGQAIPMAGMFRGIEKGGVAIAQKTGGDEHATISQSMFDPIGNAIEVGGDEDLSGGEKTLGIASSFFAPWIGGDMLHKSRKKRQLKFQKEKYEKKSLFERKKLEEQYRMEEGLATLESTKALRKKQLGMIS